jgi:hypothetical protein
MILSKIFLFLLIFFLSFMIENAYAYFDPGTGSFIIQAILGLLAAGMATIAVSWLRFKNFLLKIFKRKNKNDKK